MKAVETRVPAYATREETGALVGAVKSRVAWLKKSGPPTEKLRREIVERLTEGLDGHKEEVIGRLQALVTSLSGTDEINLSTIKSAAWVLHNWHDTLRDLAAYEFLGEEAEAASNVVRLPVAGNAQYADIDKLSPYNRRRALAVIEQMVRKQQGVEEGES